MKMQSKIFFGVFLSVLTFLLLFLFWEPITGIPNQVSLWSMDGPPLYNHDFRAQTWRELTGTNWRTDMLGLPHRTLVFQPDDLLKFIFPPLVYHLMSWICAFLLMLGATYYLLTTYGLKGLRAAIPALALGFSGYTFTLISAGHRGTPLTMGYAILALALVRQGVRKNTISHFIAAGLACVYGITKQMDLMGFLLILIAAYGLLQLTLYWPMYRETEDRRLKTEDNQPRTEGGDHPSGSAGNEEQRTKNEQLAHAKRLTSHLPPLPRLAIAIGLASVTFLLVAWPFFSHTFFGTATGRSTLDARQEEIQQTGGDRWEFITNWSLPPEGVLEFIVPSVFGRENVSQEVPYWGRLGQSMQWPETGEGFRNFRQHNLYVGGIQITFALYALFALFPKTGAAISRKRRIEIIFWLGATLVTLLFAFGRYTPLYRMIYHLPVLGNIRAPVKWFHLTEITIVILMAFGLDAFLNDLKARSAMQANRKKNKQNTLPILPGRFAIGTSAIAVLLLVAAGIAQATGLGFQSIWAAHGLAPIAPQLRNALAEAFFHATLVFAALSAILWLLLKKTTDHRPQTTDSYKLSAFSLQLSALLFILALDLGIAHKPYIHVQDVSAFYAPNPIADIILEDDPPYRVADLLSSRNRHDPIYGNLILQGVDMLYPRADQQPRGDTRALFDKLGDNPLRLWQVTSTRYIIGQRQQLEQLMQHPHIEVRAGFTITRDAKFQLVDSLQQAPLLLLEYTQALPRAYAVSNWEVVDQDQALDRLADPSFNPAQTALLERAPDGLSPTVTTAAPLQIEKWTNNRREISHNSPQPTLAVFTDAYYPGWQSANADLMRGNGISFSAPLPAGGHKNIIRRTMPWAALISLLIQSFIFVWLLLASIIRRLFETKCTKQNIVMR